MAFDLTQPQMVEHVEASAAITYMTYDHVTSLYPDFGNNAINQIITIFFIALVGDSYLVAATLLSGNNIGQLTQH